jgi:hypothetical protein
MPNWEQLKPKRVSRKISLAKLLVANSLTALPVILLAWYCVIPQIASLLKLCNKLFIMKLVITHSPHTHQLAHQITHQITNSLTNSLTTSLTTRSPPRSPTRTRSPPRLYSTLVLFLYFVARKLPAAKWDLVPKGREGE